MKKKIQKPFDVEAAKNGAKVETRDGQQVRIICYDRLGQDYPIIALLNYKNVESCLSYTVDGKLCASEDNSKDLVIVEEVEVPKFKEGEIIVNPDCMRPWLIIAASSDYYMLQDAQGHEATIYHVTIDNLYRLWTLKDAKPGNILVSTNGNRPFIFRRLHYDGAPSAYCGIDTRDSITVSASGNAWTHDPVRPATYKERLQLFNKLEEEGYKWDAESLTLSKIQKRWRDKEAEVNGYYIHSDSHIMAHSSYNTFINYNIFATKKQAKAALAMARISQIIANDKRFGGSVTNEEWDATSWHVILRSHNELMVTTRHAYEYLAFHTNEQAELFLKENEDLIKDYYMMD